MRTYETIYIIRPDLEEDATQAVCDAVEKLITGNGGKILVTEPWGKRKLAYPVKKFSEGFYVLLRIEVDETVIKKLEHHYRLDESIIRFLVVHFDEQTLRLEIEQREQEQAQLEASEARARRREDDDDDDDDDDRIGARSYGRRGRRDDDDDDD
ncbi:MAG: 30S ribosomal protein S6 [Candidatus Hydrogenedentes bacterium]|nr:30S ribosomal protein S6 [Candidatus Hydrogenedentota bacterium]